MLGDWRDGRLVGGWVKPPPSGGRSEEVMGEMDIDGGGDEGGGKAEEVLKGKGNTAEGEMEETRVVREWGEEFKIEGLWD